MTNLEKKTPQSLLCLAPTSMPLSQCHLIFHMGCGGWGCGGACDQPLGNFRNKGTETFHDQNLALSKLYSVPRPSLRGVATGKRRLPLGSSWFEYENQD